jgi:hypothetical protein
MAVQVEGNPAMKLFVLLRKGLGFLLMSMGVSSPDGKKPPAGPVSKPGR